MGVQHLNHYNLNVITVQSQLVETVELQSDYVQRTCFNYFTGQRFEDYFSFQCVFNITAPGKLKLLKANAIQNTITVMGKPMKIRC